MNRLNNTPRRQHPDAAPFSNLKLMRKLEVNGAESTELVPMASTTRENYKPRLLLFYAA